MARNFLNGVDLNLTQLLNAIIQQLATDPSLTKGRLWYHTATDTLRFTDGTNVRVLGRLDQLSAPAADLSLNNQKITNLATPVAGSDAATKDYADALALGMDLREEVRAAASSNITLSSGAQNGSVIDGVTLATGNRIALFGQTTQSQNGLYTVNASGAPTRATDFDSAGDMDRGILIPVVEGTANRGLWLHTTSGGITVDTTALTFVFIGPSSGSGTVRKAAGNIGNGSLTAITFNHALGTTDVQVQVWRANALIEPDISITDANNVVLTYATAPTASQDRVVVMG